MSSSYRKDRYVNGSSSKKGKVYFLLSLLILLPLIAVISVMSLKKINSLTSMNDKSSALIATYKKELNILRTINPYKAASNKIVQAAINNSDVFPGWVTRVYPRQEKQTNFAHQRDYGSFVMNETQFTLASHHNYGIKQPTKSVYRLSGLLPSYVKGRHQIGIEFNLIDSHESNRNEKRKSASCFAKIEVNHKKVIDEKLSMVSRFQTSHLVTGEVELGQGLYPIDAIIYCDNKSNFSDEDVEVSFSFRDPIQNSLARNTNAIFHIYSAKSI